MDVGQRIKARRQSLGLSAEQVAAIIGVSPATVYRYESAAIMNMRTDKLRPIADALSTTPAYLMGWTDDPKNTGTVESTEWSGNFTVDLPTDIEGISKLLDKSHDFLGVVPWGQSLLEAYKNADESTRKAACNVLRIDYVEPGTCIPQPIRVMPVYVFPAAAGIPLYAEDDFEKIEFPADQVPKGADFGIRIRGDSMSPTIEDGAVAWVKRQQELQNGQIGIFMLQDEAVCKRFQKEKKGIRLLSDNKVYAPIEVKDIETLGIVGRVLEYK